MSTLTLQHLTSFLLPHYLFQSVTGCPNSDLFVPCKNGGWEGTTCSSSTDTVVAYGLNSTWAYFAMTGGVGIDCNDVLFGDPLPGQRKQCCKQSVDLSSSPGISPVVNVISCGETINEFFKSYAVVPHFWKFTLDINGTVSINNCFSAYDSMLFLLDSSGERIPDIHTDCGRNDIRLTASDYYLGISFFSSATEGMYHLSLTCELAHSPTISPTETTPIPSIIPTPAPTLSSKRYCGTLSTHLWCYDVDLYPLHGAETSYTVAIANEDDNAITYFDVTFTVHDNHCVRPSILFTFEEIDFSHSSEYIVIYDNDAVEIATCRGTKDDQCGVWIDCFLVPQALPVDKIKNGETYTISIEESYGVDARCKHIHPYSINAQLTIICAADSATPTEIPTAEPSSTPTIPPTKHPTTHPTLLPSQSPVFPPTNAPTQSPTASPSQSPVLPPTVAPSYSPVIHPTTAPTTLPSDATRAPTEDPTPSPIKIIAGSNPTSSPILETTHGDYYSTDVTVDDDDDDDDLREQGSGSRREEHTYYILIAGSTLLVVICCTSVVVICYQRKRKQSEDEAQDDLGLDQVELSGNGNTTINALSNILPLDCDIDTAHNLWIAAAEQQWLSDEDGHHRRVPSHQFQHERVLTNTVSIASDMNVLDGLMITPMGNQIVHENDAMNLPSLPREIMVGEDDVDGEDDHEDLYIVPKEKETVTPLANDTYSDDSDDDEHNDVYGKPDDPETAVGQMYGEEDGDESDDDEEEEEDDNALYYKPNKPKTAEGSNK